MPQAPLTISNRFAFVESVCPTDGTLTAFTCEDWKTYLPCIYVKIGELIPLAGTTIVLEQETHNVTEALTALRLLAEWVETACCRTCEPFSELVAENYDCW